MEFLTIRLSVLALIVLATVACEASITFGGDSIEGSGDLVTETFAVDDFDGVDVSNSFEADITVGDTASVAVETDDNLVEYLEVEVRGSVLHLGLDDVSLQRGTLRATIVVPELRSLEASGASDVTVAEMAATEVDVEVSGASNVTLDSVESTRVRLEVSGASEVWMQGATESLDADVSGASDVDLDGLVVDSADLDVSGASDLRLRAAAVVRGDVSGASSLTVGESSDAMVDTSGASSLERD